MSSSPHSLLLPRQEITVFEYVVNEHLVFCFVLYFLEDADSVLKPYQFKMEEIEGFRYRCRVSVLTTHTH